MNSSLYGLGAFAIGKESIVRQHKQINLPQNLKAVRKENGYEFELKKSFCRKLRMISKERAKL